MPQKLQIYHFYYLKELKTLPSKYIFFLESLKNFEFRENSIFAVYVVWAVDKQLLKMEWIEVNR